MNSSPGVLSFVSAKMRGATTYATFGQCERLANVLSIPFDELFSSYRRKSFAVKLPLRTKFLSGANKLAPF